MTTLGSRLLAGVALFLLTSSTVACTEVDTGSQPLAGPSTSNRTTSTTSASSEPSEPIASGRVLLTDDGEPVARDLERLVRQFVDYAVEQADDFPYANSVTMSLGGQAAVVVDDIAATLPNRNIWEVCPADWDFYGASDCPVNLLAPMAEALVNKTPIVVTSTFGSVTCAPNRTGPLPAGRLVILRPTQERRTCATDFALVLAADGMGRLKAVDLTLAAP